MAEGGAQEKCMYYNSPRGCWNGDNCRFLHIKDDVRPKCRFFSGPGTCRYGDNCFFRHAVIDSVSAHQKDESLPLKDISNITQKEREPVMCTSKKSNQISRMSANDARPDLSAESSNNSTALDENQKDSDSKILKCGECGQIFKDDTDSDNDPLLEHYMAKLTKWDIKHLEFLKDPVFNTASFCNICDRFFGRVKDYLRHVTDKVKNGKADALKHKELLESVAIDFCSRDIGITGKSEFNDSILTTLVSAYEGINSDDSDEEVGGLATTLAMLLGKQRYSKNFCPLDVLDDSDDSDDIYSSNPWGFDESDIFELACQGIKPWDPEASAALAVLNGYDDY